MISPHVFHHNKEEGYHPHPLHLSVKYVCHIQNCERNPQNFHVLGEDGMVTSSAAGDVEVIDERGGRYESAWDNI